MATQHAATSRSREAPQGDEEASSELRLGEFQHVDALTHSEAALVINALVAKRRVDRKNVNETEYVPFSLLPLHLGRVGGSVGSAWGMHAALYEGFYDRVYGCVIMDGSVA